MPVFTQKTVDLIKNKFWFSVLIGFVTLIVIPVVGIIFAVTVLGIPIALVLMFVYFVLIYIAKIFISLTIGKFFTEKAKWNLNSYWAFVLGIFIYYIIGFVPVAGGLPSNVPMGRRGRRHTGVDATPRDAAVGRGGGADGRQEIQSLGHDHHHNAPGLDRHPATAGPAVSNMMQEK